MRIDSSLPYPDAGKRLTYAELTGQVGETAARIVLEETAKAGKRG